MIDVCAVFSAICDLDGARQLPNQQTLLLVDPAAITLQLEPEGQAHVVGREFLGNGWQYRFSRFLARESTSTS